jgi:hypothetical protein
MSKLILSINTRNKSFNLLKQVYKDFGVVFHPNSSERKGLVGKAKEDKEQQEIISLEDTSDEVSSSYGLKREDK